MIENRDIICFSSDWGGHIDSSHHIIRRMMENNRVLWVNSTGLRAPRPSLYDVRRAWNKLFSRPVAGDGGPSSPIEVYSPTVIPLYGSRLATAFNRRALKANLLARIERYKLSRIIVWACIPTASLVIDDLCPALVVYYVMDDYTAMPGVNTRAIRNLERRLFDQSDIVLVTAKHLRQAKLSYGKPIGILPHGVDFEHFAGPQSRPPQEFVKIPRPIIGFFGLMAPWIDVEMMVSVAKENPGFSFVFIGDVQTDLRGLVELSNTYLIPTVPYETLPTYARQFDVSILPFVIDEMTVNVNPLKLLEYLSTGSPVVSTRLPEVEQYEPHIRIADTAAEFSGAVRAALAEDTERARAARIEIARGSSWESRVATASTIIEKALAERES